MRFARTRAALGAFFGTGLLAVAGAAGAVVLPAGPAAAGTGPAVAGTGVPQRGVPIPHGELFGVAETSASNAWAVGQDYVHGKTNILHWNGTAWKQVPSPTPKTGGALFGVTATSATNAWAVGCAGNCFQGFGGIKTLILHWNGVAWKQVPSPSPGNGSALSSVTAASANSAWAVGCTAFCFLHSVAPQTVILHWNGTAWTQVPSPAQARIGALSGVAATSAGDVWAVGCAGHCFGPM